MGGGAWPFLVGGVSCHCLIAVTNETFACYIVSCIFGYKSNFLDGLSASSRWKLEAITGL